MAEVPLNLRLEVEIGGPKPPQRPQRKFNRYGVETASSRRLQEVHDAYMRGYTAGFAAAACTRPTE